MPHENLVLTNKNQKEYCPLSLCGSLCLLQVVFHEAAGWESAIPSLTSSRASWAVWQGNELFMTSFPGCLRKAELEFSWMDTNSSYLTNPKVNPKAVCQMYTWGIHGEPCGRADARETHLAMLHCLTSVCQHRDLLGCPSPCTNGWREISMLSPFQTMMTKAEWGLGTERNRWKKRQSETEEICFTEWHLKEWLFHWSLPGHPLVTTSSLPILKPVRSVQVMHAYKDWEVRKKRNIIVYKE